MGFGKHRDLHGEIKFLSSQGISSVGTKTEIEYGCKLGTNRKS